MVVHDFINSFEVSLMGYDHAIDNLKYRSKFTLRVWDIFAVFGYLQSMVRRWRLRYADLCFQPLQMLVRLYQHTWRLSTSRGHLRLNLKGARHCPLTNNHSCDTTTATGSRVQIPLAWSWARTSASWARCRWGRRDCRETLPLWRQHPHFPYIDVLVWNWTKKSW